MVQSVVCAARPSDRRHLFWLPQPVSAPQFAVEEHDPPFTSLLEPRHDSKQ